MVTIPTYHDVLPNNKKRKPPFAEDGFLTNLP